MVDVGGVAGTVLNVAVIVGSVTIIGAVVILIVRGIMVAKRYNIPVYIFEKDGMGQLTMTRDKGGVFVDGLTKNKLFFMRKNKGVGLNADQVPYIWYYGKKLVFLKRIGLKNFEYIHSFQNIFEEEEDIEVDEEDVNWAINELQRSQKVFGTSTLQQLLPYIGIALMGLFILAMLVVLFQKISVLGDVARAFEEAAKAFAAAKSGTTVIQ